MAEVIDDTRTFSITLTTPVSIPEIDLEWIRDNYDTNRNRYIDHEEVLKARDDYFAKKIISHAQVVAVVEAYNSKTQLPAWPAPAQVAKGELTSISFPTTAKHGESFTITARIKNVGTAGGTFAVKVSGSGINKTGSRVYVNTGALSSTITLPVQAPGSGTTASYELSCIRYT